MGVGWETVGAALSNAAAATAQAMTPFSGQSFSVRATANGSAPVTLEAVSTDFQDAGDFRIRSPRLHDDVNAMRFAATPSLFDNVALEYFEQPVFSQDNLIVEAVFTVAPTAAHISLGFFTLCYADVPGISGLYRTWAEVAPNIVNYLAVPVTVTSAGVANTWGPGIAINSSVDVFKANTLYALIGYVAPVAFGAWAIQGVDIGNLQYGAPGVAQPVTTRRYFPWLDQNSQQPAIPVINSQNKATTNVFLADRTISTAFELTMIWAQLSA